MNLITKKLNELEIAKKREFIILGNGPSIVTYLDYKSSLNGCVVGFNRVDKFLRQNSLHLDIYICVSDNVSHIHWGQDWTQSVHHGINNAKIVLVGTEQVLALKKWNLWNERFLSKLIIVDDVISELPLFKTTAFPYKHNYDSAAVKSLSKTGTSINVAYCIAAALRVEIIHLFGCDLGWKSSKGALGTDQNHYFSDYQAKIIAPNIENIRMDFIHMNFAQQLLEYVKVFNYSDISIINYFQKVRQGIDGIPPSISRYYWTRLILLIDECSRILKRTLVKILRKSGLKK